MPVSESQKEARNKWDSANMKTIGCKLKLEDAESFIAYAKSKGKTANALLKDYVMECIEKNK